MRILVMAFAILGLITAARAADDFMIKLPEDGDSKQVFLFQFKKNNIFMKTDVKDFCRTMKYGDFVDGRPTEIVEDHQVIVVIDWVICRMPGNPAKKS